MNKESAESPKILRIGNFEVLEVGELKTRVCDAFLYCKKSHCLYVRPMKTRWTRYNCIVVNRWVDLMEIENGV
jgi:hypothetical protein